MASKAAMKYRKPDATGRSKGSQSRHIQLYHYEMQSEAWQSLSCVARCLYLKLMAIYNGGNNGAIALSVRDAAKALNVDVKTARKAFDGLVAHGFIKVAKNSSFNCKQRKAREFELTAFERDGKKASKEFMSWQIQKTVGARPSNSGSTSHREGLKEASTSADSGSMSHREGKETPSDSGSTSPTYNIPGEGVSAVPKRASERPDLVGENQKENPPRHHVEPEFLYSLPNRQREQAEQAWIQEMLNLKDGTKIFEFVPPEITKDATDAELSKPGAGIEVVSSWWRERAA